MTDELERHLEDCESFLRAIRAAASERELDFDAARRSYDGLVQSVGDLRGALLDAEDAEDAMDAPDDLDELRRSDDRERAGSMAGEIA